MATHPFFVLLLFYIVVVCYGVDFSDVCELRIHDSAPVGSKMTMNEALERRVRNSKNCFGQLEPDIDWIDFDTTRSVFVTRAMVPSSGSDPTKAVLHMMCPSNQMDSIPFAVQITRKNRHPPQFSLESYQFYAPVSLPKGAEVGRIVVVDHDPVVYNSQYQLVLIGKNKHFSVEKNGSVLIKSPLHGLPLYRPTRLRLLAVDFGSPQLFSSVNLTITPVTVSEMKDIRVNVANTKYQIYEWDGPEYGIADRVRITVQRQGDVVYEKEVDGQQNIHMAQIPLQAASDYTLRLTAIDVDGETPSDVHRFSVLNKEVQCDGVCSGGGMPMCYNGKFHRIEQYKDEYGPHCLCFDGYSSAQCEHKESCEAEHAVDVYGEVDWPRIFVNETATVLCPFGAEGEKITRICRWDRRSQMAVWEAVADMDVCRKQSSVLVHLGVLANYAEKSANTVSGVEAVQRFISTMLTYPAFEPNITTAHFDPRIAEHALHVIDTIITKNFSDVRGNVTKFKNDFHELILDFSSRIPVPYTIESSKNGIHMKTFNWVANAENFPTNIGQSCYLEMPRSDVNDHVRTICMTNPTLYPIIDGSNPVMSVEMDHGSSMPKGAIARIGLKPMNASENYTCVYFDKNENGWSTNGIKLLSRNFESGLVLCETSHFSLFTLLPESMFYSPVSFTDLNHLCPILTTVITVILSLFLLLISMLQRNLLVDPALLLLQLLSLINHLVQLGIMTLPGFVSLRNYDGQIQFCFQFLLVSIAVLFAFLNSTIYSKLAHDRTPIFSFFRTLMIFFVAIVFPLALCISSYYLDGFVLQNIATKQQRIQLNFPFLCHFVLPIAVFGTIALSYGVASICRCQMEQRKARSMPEKNEHFKNALKAVWMSYVLIIAVYMEVVFLFNRRGSPKVAAFCFIQIIYCIGLFFLSCYHLRLQQRPPAESPTRTLERKRDISRDHLLGVPKTGTETNGHFSYRDSIESDLSKYSAFKPVLDSIYIDSNVPPMVSIV
ncbi:hypothetical protein QR680_003087 [Steinernema hermaphroditum]|uniref:GPS domain-containing protein n=1 Tax=Steinernema hermaphroditum TaxID=289476 RepID=A0AA39LJE9_9BILA|nr:hypothetical protein QR680_003087 [Steinernema hermaphroditum]